MGVGNVLRGDDGVGPFVAEEIEGDEWLGLDCSTAPGKFTSKVKRREPELLVIVDAAKMGKEPGDRGILDYNQADRAFLSTHTIPISVTAKYLSQYCKKLLFIGIEPKEIMDREGLSKAVYQSARELVNILKDGRFGDI